MQKSTQSNTFSKVLSILKIIASDDKSLKFSEIQKASNFPKANVSRYLKMLLAENLITFNPENATYSLGLTLVSLAHKAWEQNSLAQIAHDTLLKLAAETHLAIHLAQLSGGMVLYVDKINSPTPMDIFSQAGRIGPAYCTGVGKAMLAWLPTDAREQILTAQSFKRYTPTTICTKDLLEAELERIKKHGYAVDNEEHERDVCCLAVPILSQQGRVLGGLSITMQTSGDKLSVLKPYLPKLRQASEEIAHLTQTWRFPERQPS